MWVSNSIGRCPGSSAAPCRLRRCWRKAPAHRKKGQGIIVYLRDERRHRTALAYGIGDCSSTRKPVRRRSASSKSSTPFSMPSPFRHARRQSRCSSTTRAGSAQNPRDGRQCDLSSLPRKQANASGVVEVRPPPVIVDLYTPTRLGVIDGLGKPCVRTLSAVDIPGRDDFAVRIDNSERNHGM